MAMINMMVASENTSVVISDDAEADEMRSFVESRANQRWLRNAADHNSGKILAHTFGKREDKVFVELRGLPGILRKSFSRGSSASARSSSASFSDFVRRGFFFASFSAGRLLRCLPLTLYQ